MFQMILLINTITLNLHNDVKFDFYAKSNVDSKDTNPKFKIGNLVRI